MGACLGGASSADNQLWAYVDPDNAAKYGGPVEPQQVEVLETMLSAKKIDINSRRDGGNTPLHHVCRENAPPSVPVIEWLFARGPPQIDAVNDSQKMPIHCAAGGRSVENLRALIRFNADVNARGAFRSTPIMYACALGIHANADALLEHPHIDVTAVNDNGDSALNRLARLGSRERNSEDDLRVATALIKRGASLSAANNENFTPILSAMAAGKANLAAYFLWCGADFDVKNTYGEGRKELATRDHMKFVVNTYDALIGFGVLDARLIGAVLMYAVQSTNEAK